MDMYNDEYFNIKILEPDCMYCESKHLADQLKDSHPEFKIKYQPNRVIFRLIHLFKQSNDSLQQIVLGCCIDQDMELNFLVCLQSSEYVISSDHINKIIILKNFQTKTCYQKLTVIDDSDPDFGSRQIFGLLLYASDELQSNLKLCDTIQEAIDSINNELLDALINDCDNVEGNNATGQISNSESNSNKNRNIDSPNVENTQASVANSNVSRSDFNMKVHSTISQSTVSQGTSLFSTAEPQISNENLETIVLNRPKLSEDMKTSFTMYCYKSLFEKLLRYVKGNINLLSLSKFYSKSLVTNLAFVNIIGVISGVNYYPDRIELTLFDEYSKDITVKIIRETIDEDDDDISDLEIVDFKCGKIICIRDVICKKQSIGECVNADKLMLVDPFYQNDLLEVYSENYLSIEEIIKIGDLFLYSCLKLYYSCKENEALENLNSVNFVGQLLAKFSYEPKQFTVFILLPFRNSVRTYMDLGLQNAIIQQLNQSLNHKQKSYSFDIIEDLLEKNYIISITLSSEYKKVFNKINILDLVVFFNITIRSDPKNKNMYQYSLFNQADGSRCCPLDKESPLCNFFFKVINENMNLVKIEQADSATTSIYSFDEMQFEVIDSIQQTTEIVIREPFKRLYNPGLNIDLVLQVQSFPDIYKLENHDSHFFRIQVKVVDYNFEHNGLIINNMSTLRSAYFYILCESTLCDFEISFHQFLPQILRMISSNNTDMKFKCPKCSSELKAHCGIQLFLQDTSGVLFSVLLTHPEFETIFSCSNEQLFFCNSRSNNIIIAIEYWLSTICPNQSTKKLIKMTPSELKQTKLDGEAIKSNPNFDCVIQKVSTSVEQGKFIKTNYPHLFNDQVDHIFQLRTIKLI